MATAGVTTISGNRVTPLAFVIPPISALVGTRLVLQGVVGPATDVLQWRATNFWEGVIAP